MDKPEHFEILDTHAVFRPTGEVSLKQAERLVTSAIAFAREQDIGRLLVDITGITGFESPSIAARYLLVQEWARVADMRVRVSIVCRSELIDPQKFGVTAARNFGLIGDVFETEEETLAWLLQSQ